MIDLTPALLKIIKDILIKNVPTAKVMAFGSRVKGHAKPFSDLDLAIDNSKPLSLSEMAHLRDDFSESALPIKVDIVDWHSIDDRFKKVILEKFYTIN